MSDQPAKPTNEAAKSPKQAASNKPQQFANANADSASKDENAALFAEFMAWKGRFNENSGTLAANTPQGGLNEQQVARIVRAVSDGRTNGHGMLNPEWSDPADVIEPVRFFSPHSYYHIYSKRAGQFTEGLPNGLRVLSFVYDPANSNPKTRKFSCTLMVTSHSVFKWLTGEDLHGNKVGTPHPEFRVTFYMDKDKLPADNFAAWEQLYSGHVRALESMPHTALLKTAMDEWGIEPSSSLDKRQIAVMIAKKRADSEYGHKIKGIEQAAKASADLANAAFAFAG